MAKDKYDFIQELLESKKISPAQRERVLLLGKKEIEKEGTLGKELEERVKRLEEIIIGSNDGRSSKTVSVQAAENIDHSNFKEVAEREDEENETSEESNYSDLPKYYYPSSLYKFLLRYNTNEVLKSTCHEIDSNELETINQYCKTEQYDFEKHVEKIMEAFKSLEKEFAPPAVKALIRGYLKGKKYGGSFLLEGWSSQKIKINWQSQELKEWSAKNPGIPPNLDEGLMEKLEKTGYELNQPIQVQNGIISRFSDLVLHFKHLIHIRRDNSLKSIIEAENNRKYLDKIEFQIDDDGFPANIEFFTDVDKLIQSYNSIIKLILEQGEPSKPMVKLSLTEKEKTIEFSILHFDSKYGKSINNAKDRLGSTYRNLIKNLINGLCNFYVRADFENKESYKVGIWNKPDLWTKYKPIPEKLNKPVGGVEHIFEIVKP